jgi:hypothetical protein
MEREGSLACSEQPASSAIRQRSPEVFSFVFSQVKARKQQLPGVAPTWLLRVRARLPLIKNPSPWGDHS